jgi:hypothetical protein
LAAGTYNGTITVTASSAANSPQTVAVTLNVTAPVPNLTVSPATLTFAYQTGGSTPAAQNVSVASSGGALSYTVASSATWLTATPASGSTPGTLSVAVNPTGLAAGTYNGTITVTASSAANSPRTVAVTLAITNPGTGSLSAFPRTLSFNSGHESEDGRSRSSRRLRVTSNPGALQFTAAALGGSWLSVSAAGGTTPATLAVTASPVGLARGSYTGQIQLSAPGAGSISVPVTLTVAGEGGGEDSSFRTTTYTYDPTNTGAVAATWVYGAGVPATDASDPTNQGLMLSNNAPAASKARAGVILDGVANTALIVLGFDMRQGSLCSTRGPRFIVVTSDDVAHAVGGCKAANSQPAPAPGWTRFVFTPAQASPAIAPGSTVKSIALMLDDGPDAAGGIVVLDNINLNGTLIGHE